MVEIAALADYMFATVEKIAGRLYEEKVDPEVAFKVMHQPKEAPK